MQLPPLTPLAATIPDPHPAMVLPFCAMLLSIALLPVVLKHHWERFYHVVAVGLGAISAPGPVGRLVGSPRPACAAAACKRGR